MANQRRLFFIITLYEVNEPIGTEATASGDVCPCERIQMNILYTVVRQQRQHQGSLCSEIVLWVIIIGIFFGLVGL